MARRRGNVRLARAAERAREREADGLIGQFLVLGFGGVPRLINFSARGRTMRALDAATGVDVRVPVKLPWLIAHIARGSHA